MRSRLISCERRRIATANMAEAKPHSFFADNLLEFGPYFTARDNDDESSWLATDDPLRHAHPVGLVGTQLEGNVPGTVYFLRGGDAVGFSPLDASLRVRNDRQHIPLVVEHGGPILYVPRSELIQRVRGLGWGVLSAGDGTAGPLGPHGKFANLTPGGHVSEVRLYLPRGGSGPIRSLAVRHGSHGLAELPAAEALREAAIPIVHIWDAVIDHDLHGLAGGGGLVQFAPESMGAWVLRCLGLAEEGTTGVNIVSVPVAIVANLLAAALYLCKGNSMCNR